MNATIVSKLLTLTILVGLGTAVTAAPPQDTGKAIVDTKNQPKLSILRLGQTADEISTQYGKPTRTETFVSGIESLSFQHGGVRLLVEISPVTKQAIQIFYFKATPFTGTQIGELLERNAEGSKWAPVLSAEGGSSFERIDGGTMRSRKVADEYMLAFLSGSEVRGRHPEADAAREQEMKRSLQEIE